MIYLVFFLIAGAAALYLMYSDNRIARRDSDSADPQQQIRDRQTAIRLSLNDLQYELSVGKVEQQDFARLQSELLAEWETLEGRLAAMPVSQKKQATECTQCGASLLENARFCHACGAKVLQLLLLLLLWPAGQLDALDIRVQIKNGTKGQLHTQPLKVQLLKLEKGMQPVTSNTSNNGRTEFLQLPENTMGPYMVQTEYRSVTYSKVIPPNMPSPADVTLDVYESTTSAERVRVRTLVEVRRVAEDKLAGIMILFFMNQDNRTFTGSGGLDFFLPAQAVVEQASVSVGSGASNIQWLKVTAEKTGAPGAYRITQSVKPGERIAQVMFSLPYAAAGTALSFRSVYPQDAGFQLIAEPENLEVRQAGRLLTRVKDPNLGRGLISFPVAESRIELKFSGGSIAEGRADESEAEIVVRSPLETWQKLLFPFLALLIFFVVFRLREKLRATKS
ncbi:MAG: zinc ribbon domain-containing protein [Spirochaetota bacterium]